MDTPLVGIDYGSKLAGTPVLTLAFEGRLEVHQSVKKKDADKLILETLGELPVGVVGLDAPLSLPGVFTNPDKFTDYFYRACDRELKAMSPMFLGGLTARAMRLTSQLRDLGWEVGEIYPAALVKTIDLSAPQGVGLSAPQGVGLSAPQGVGLSAYAKNTPASIPEVEAELNRLLNSLGVLPTLKNYHQVDSALALLATLRKVKGEGLTIGDEEGLIWV